MDRVSVGGLAVARVLHDFVAEALPGTGLKADAFWSGLGSIVTDLAPRNRALLDTRDRLQAELDAWHHARRGRPIDAAEYQQFLREIGYLVPEPSAVAVETSGVDQEIAAIARPFEIHRSDFADDCFRPVRHHNNTIGEQDSFIDIVRNHERGDARFLAKVPQ